MNGAKKGYIIENEVIPKTNLDYILFYAERLKTDNSIFHQHKKFIENQFQASSSLYKNMFGLGKQFKINARKYLKKIQLI